MVNVIKIISLLFFTSFLLLPFEQGRGFAYADVDCIPIGGQAWNQYLGWVVSQGTIINAAGIDTEEAYGICKEDPTGIEKKNVKGAVWSVYGWICWGKSCDMNGYGNKTPPQNIPGTLSTLDAYIDETVEKTLTRNFPPELNKPPITIKYYPVTGWAKITNLKDNGWVSLSGDIDADNVQDLEDFNNKNFDCKNAAAAVKEKKCKYFVYYDIDKNEFGGWAWNNKVGWIGFSGRTLYTTPYQYNTPTGTVKGNACDPYCKEASYDDDIDSNKFLTQYLGRWVDVRGGNAYAQKGFGGKSASPPKAISYIKATGKYQVTNAGGTQEEKEGVLGSSWRSGCDDNSVCNEFGVKKKISGVPGVTLKGLYDVGTPKISSGSTVKELKSKLGSLNVEELVLPAGSMGRTNKYGQKVIRVVDPLTLNESAVPPDPKHLKHILYARGDKPTIYYYEGDLHIGNPNGTHLNNEWEINRGELADNTSGARTIVVVGNLIINTRITYKTDSVESLKKLPSVAWIVLEKPGVPGSGNIKINNCIHPRGIGGAGEAVPLAGLFFAENTIETGTGGTKNIKCRKRKIDGSFDGTQEFIEAPLRIYGKLVAKKIELQRGWRGFSKASEAIWDDGRLIVNPPPGIEEFVKKLPLW